jgi:hypothetical protein
MSNLITKHGVLNTPNFFPVIGWPAGRGEYDRLFKLLDQFVDATGHNNYLFNFSSFIFGFSIPSIKKGPIDLAFFEKYKNKDLREILIQETKINSKTSKNLISLLDVGGNRIFNKIVLDNKDVLSIDSYKIYIDTYFDFIKSSNADIYVSFDIGPSYTTKDANSKKGVKIWENIPELDKTKLAKKLLDISIKRKLPNTKVMVPIGAKDLGELKKYLNYLHTNYRDQIDYLGIGGIANQGLKDLEKTLKLISDFIVENKWNVKVHGLGMGGWKKIPYLIKYNIDTCDVATAWRRACTDSPSNIYVPLFDDKGKLTNYQNALKYFDLYDKNWDNIDFKLSGSNITLHELIKVYRKSDKANSKEKNHSEDYYDMRVLIYFHNVLQHIQLQSMLYQYKNKFGNAFIKKFADEVNCLSLKKYFLNIEK